MKRAIAEQRHDHAAMGERIHSQNIPHWVHLAKRIVPVKTSHTMTMLPPPIRLLLSPMMMMMMMLGFMRGGLRNIIIMKMCSSIIVCEECSSILHICCPSSSCFVIAWLWICIAWLCSVVYVGCCCFARQQRPLVFSVVLFVVVVVDFVLLVVA